MGGKGNKGGRWWGDATEEEGEHAWGAAPGSLATFWWNGWRAFAANKTFRGFVASSEFGLEERRNGFGGEIA